MGLNNVCFASPNLFEMVYIHKDVTQSCTADKAI